MDAADPTTVARQFRWRTPALPGGRKLRLAVPRGCTEKVQPAVRDNFEASLAVLQEYATVERDVAWPDLPWGQATATIVNAEDAALPAALVGRGAWTACAVRLIGSAATRGS